MDTATWNRLRISMFRLHHNGYLTADLETAAALLEKRFNYVREGATVHDPIQTAHVLLLRLPGDQPWLELVTPDGPASKLARALRKDGEGWHHVCYEVEDILAAGLRLRDQGMLPLCEPVPASAFPGRRLSWFMDAKGFLVELVEARDRVAPSL
jgi:methylmalonyl-CoA/ethylmalonyl-CoA epimerase